MSQMSHRSHSSALEKRSETVWKLTEKSPEKLIEGRHKLPREEWIDWFMKIMVY